MNEIIKDYIGKDCIIHTIDSQIYGIIEGVDDKWVRVVDNKGNQELISLEFISRIRMFPVNKNGKKKIFT